MQQPIVNYDAVTAAADAIRASGKNPSVRAVRDAIGGGSLTTITEFMRRWRNAQTEVRKNNVQINPKIIELIGEQIEKASNTILHEKEAEILILQEDLDGLQKAAQNLENANSDLERERLEANALANKFLGQIEELNKQLSRVTVESEYAVSNALSDLREAERAAESAQRDKAVNEALLHEVQKRLSEYKAIQEDRDAERQKKIDAERKLAGLEARSEAEVKHVLDLQSTLKGHEKTIRHLEQRLAENSESWNSERRQLDLKIQDLEQRVAALLKSASAQELV